MAADHGIPSSSMTNSDSILYGDAQLLHRSQNWRPAEVDPLMLGQSFFEGAEYDQETWVGGETWVARTESLPEEYRPDRRIEQVPKLMHTLIKRLLLDQEVAELGVEPQWQVAVDLHADEDEDIVWVYPREPLRCILDSQPAIDESGLPGDAHPMALIEELFADKDLDDVPEWIGVEQLMLNGSYFFGMLYLAGNEPLGCVTIIGDTGEQTQVIKE